MSDIQKARDVLAKWREDSTPGPWRFNSQVPRYVLGSEPFDEVADLVNGHTDARLIVGTAGDPNLLDAIDSMLGSIVRAPAYFYGTAFSAQVERIAAAIIAADERMSA